MKLQILAAVFACLPATSFAATVVVPSTGSVSETVERLVASVEDHGARVFGVVDFGAGVRSTGEEVGDLQLVIFGDPRLAALAVSSDLMSALDLPAKVLVYGTPDGSAMAYEVPADMLAEWNIPPDAPVFEMMSRALEAITSDAAE